jgi:Mg-chelatase subunit ChlD
MDNIDNNVEAQFICPISLEIMKDPYIAPDGLSYEYIAICKWLETHDTCPGNPSKYLTKNSLIRNNALRNAIEAYERENKTNNNIIQNNLQMLVPNDLKIQCSVQSQEINNKIVSLITLNSNIEIPNIHNRDPVILIILLDVSGSMNASIDRKDAKELSGLSRLDLVKHATKTIFGALGSKDYVCVITFSNVAQIVLPFTQMTTIGKQTASSKIENLKPDGMTNIWDALRLAFSISDNNSTNIKKNIMLFTDGVSNINPPTGIVTAVKNGIAKCKSPISISTFGFGYGDDLDSDQLTQISNICNGTYAYIPDASMLGTVFVNCISNILCTAFHNVTFCLKDSDLSDVTLLGYMKKIGEFDFNIGSIQHGQPRHILLRFNKNNTNIKICIKFNKMEIITPLYNNNKIVDNKIFFTEYCRISLIECLNDALYCTKADVTKLNLARAKVLELYNLFSENPPSEQTINMMSDIRNGGMKGQIELALSDKDMFTKWGVHYIPSLINSHLLEQCGNFKDLGIQTYGGVLFNEIRECANQIFCDLPAPKPSIQIQHNDKKAPIVMKSYVNRGGVCFDGEALVRLNDNSFKKVKNIKKDDILFNFARVICLVRTIIHDNNYDMVKINNVLVTPWHPILNNGEWQFPAMISNIINVKIQYIYNLVLDSYHCVHLNSLSNNNQSNNNIDPSSDLILATLGHGINSNNIIKHDYFGTNKVIHDLEKLSGYNNGFVELNNHCIKRSEDNGLVISIE